SGSAPLVLEAQAKDPSGAQSATVQRTVTVLDDGVQSVAVSLAAEPSGSVLLGGSTLSLVGTAEGFTPALSVAVAGEMVPVHPLQGEPGVEAVLPEGPEGAPVLERATVAAPGGAFGAAEREGALAVFASGPPAVVSDAVEPRDVVALVSRADHIAVL